MKLVFVHCTSGTALVLQKGSFEEKQCAEWMIQNDTFINVKSRAVLFMVVNIV